jgi:hypothetical protein
MFVLPTFNFYATALVIHKEDDDGFVPISTLLIEQEAEGFVYIPANGEKSVFRKD